MNILYYKGVSLVVRGPSLEEYDTADGWHVRKWSDGYVEMTYQNNISIAKSQWTEMQSWYWVPNVLGGIQYPISLVEQYSERASGNIDIFAIFTGYGMAAHVNSVGAYAFVRPTIPAADSYSGKVEVTITGCWK